MKVEKQLGKFSEQDIQNFEFIKSELDNIARLDLNEDTIKRLESLEKSLWIIRETYTHRLINLLKHK